MFYEHEQSNYSTLEIEKLINLLIESHSNYWSMFMPLINKFIENAENLNISH